MCCNFCSVLCLADVCGSMHPRREKDSFLFFERIPVSYIFWVPCVLFLLFFFPAELCIKGCSSCKNGSFLKYHKEEQLLM